MVFSAIVNRSQRSKKAMGITSAAVLASALVAGAVIYPGFNTADVVLNDGSVWVTNSTVNMVGHLNVQSKVLDGGFTATTTGFDVLQNSGTVYMDNDSGSLLNQVNVPAMALTSDTTLAGTKKVSLGSELTVITDPAAGKVWALPESAVSSFNDKTTKPVLSKATNAQAVVGLNTTGGVSDVFVLDPRGGELTTLKVSADGKVADSSTAKLDSLPDSGKLQLSVVGDQPVVLDPSIGTLFLPGNKKVAVPNGKDGKLQQRSTDGKSVAVETAKGLVLQPLGGSQATIVDAGATGRAIAPVLQDGCVHAAWNGSNKYLHHCPGQEDKVVAVPKAGGQSELVFRQNRDVVVLNDTAGGDVWLVNQNLLLVNNWQDLTTDQKNADNADKESADPNVVNTLPDRTKPNRPPEAVADSFGVRAGSTTLLPVLYNDSDPDGDVLTISENAPSIKAGTLQTVYGGTGLQLVVPASAAPGTESFSYTASDGRGGTAAAPVSVRVVAESENSAPVSLRPTTVVVAQGASISQNVLADMIDPDGDEIYLVGATAGDATGQVKFTPNGELTYIDNGEDSGPKTVTIKVSDTRAITEKTIQVSVKPAGGVPPIANADYVRVVAGQSAVVSPLKNDQDPSGGELRLASVDKPANGEVSAIADNGTFTFTSTATGTVYLPYQVTNGPQSATGLIRIDVQPAVDAAPIAVKDTAMLPVGGTTLVDVLGNDSDLSGGVLVVKSVSVPAGSGLSANVLDHHVVKLTDISDPGQPVTITYTVSNGKGTATGTVSVVRIPAESTLQPPVARPDTVNVRVGDVVRIPVLANDYDPNGDVLKHPEITQRPDEATGKLWVDQDALRFLAGPTAGSVSAIYKVTNNSGQVDSAAVSINVIAADPEHNLPPAPKNVTGRVIAGTATRIQIPLDGIDPDGDSVQLIGIGTPPKLGTAVAGNGFISYTAAGNSAGTDTFTYRVKDRLGAEAVGTVEVGIAKAAAVNHPPEAADDFISMRPGRQVALDVVLNDSDPDGDKLAVVKNGFAGPEEMAPRVTDLGRVVVTAPQAAGTATLGYTVADPSGASDHGNIRMTVTPDAPLRAPIARDDTVTTEEALGKNTVNVPVLKNDEDPDGVAEQLKVTLAQTTPTASVNQDGTLQIALTDGPQMVAYTVTDQDKLASTAIVWVPGLGEQYPVLSKTDIIKVQAGSTATLRLSDYVKVRAGHTPRVTQVDKISLIGAPTTGSLSADGSSILYKSNEDFYGPGSITFEVTDGTSPEDPQGLKSTLTVMTDVLPAPAKNLAPKFIGTALNVAQVESVESNLELLASDPEKDSLKFSLTGKSSAGLKTEINGAVLKVTAEKNAVLGSTQTVDVQASDGHNPPVDAQITVTVTSSNKPLAVANDDSVPDAHAGRTESVPVLSNDVNPFPDTALKIADAKLVTGASGTKVAVAGDKVNVTAPEDFTGNVVVSYTLEDKTGDPARRVNGRIVMNVKGKPGVPTAPRVEEVKSKQVMLKWSTPVDNGSPITGYTVKKSDGGTQNCATNTCLITGLTNAKPYTFVVSAKNAVGESADSPASAKATPDQQPDTPAAPMVVRGDTQLDVSWVTPVGEYSPVSSYNVQISPAPKGQNPQKTGIKGNKVTWTGLTNGVAYTFRVQALNAAPNPSNWSPYAPVPVKPAGKPFTPAAPTTTLVSPAGTTNQVRVDWKEPNLNGGILKNYTLTTYLDGQTKGSVSTTSPTATVDLPNGTGAYTFRVVATTEVSSSGASAPSAGRRSVSKPGQVQGVTIAEANTGAAGGKVTVNFTPLSGTGTGGSTGGELVYHAKVSSNGTDVVVTPGASVPAPNGDATTVTVYAKSSAFATAGDASPKSNSVTPFGTPGTAGVGGSNGGTGSTSFSYSWSFPGGAVDAASVQVKVGNGGWASKSSNGSASYNTGGNDKTVTVSVRSVNSVGTFGPIASKNLSSGPPKPPAPTEWDMHATPTQTCLETASGNSDHFTPGNPANCSSQWLKANVNVKVNCYRDWGSNRWLHISTPGYGGYGFAKASTTSLESTPSGMPKC
ncbi:Ig-like domain-containing protein [Arthrobacter cryoconiti]|uniref:Ig-like domain-containing protein n=1 Tax=Arthrobacter cryoconiti TaxID=748907 RepID=A0ABV8R464_9MICC|nr:Ig-like domain-containing protein [Arthrobacter cryoconiti]MCC9067080.1 Ig-like domain-containing protein [Arthrobacter cryoconiti]